MTKKRFTMIDYYESDGNVVYYDYGEEMGILDVLDVLNGLDGTVKHLSDDYQNLMEENNQLKQQLNDKEIRWLCDNTVWEQMPSNKKTNYQSTCITIQKSKVKDLERENEKLKEIIINVFDSILELDFAKGLYYNAILRIIGEEDDVGKAKERIREFLDYL